MIKHLWREPDVASVSGFIVIDYSSATTNLIFNVDSAFVIYVHVIFTNTLTKI